MTREGIARSHGSGWLIRLIELGLLGAAVLGAVVGLARKVPIFTRFSDAVDFAFYYQAAAALRGGESPYTEPFYIYPPFLAAVLAPLTALSLPGATLVWFLINIAIAVVIVWLFVRLTGLEGWGVAAAALAVVLFPSTYDTILLGQVNLIIAACVMGALLASGSARSDRAGDVVAGALIGVATLIKLYPAALMLSYALRRRFAALASFSAMLIGGVLLGIVVSGGAGPTRHYATEILPRLAFELQDKIENQAVPAVVSRLTSDFEQEFRVSMIDSVVTVSFDPPVEAPRAGRALSFLARAVLVVVMLWLLVRSRGVASYDPGLGADLAVIVPTVLLANSVTWNYYFVILLVPVAFLIRAGDWARPDVRIPLLGAALLIVVHRYWVPLTYWAQSPWVTIFGFLGVLIIWALVVRKVVTARNETA
jgi:hypothetical protein